MATITFETDDKGDLVGETPAELTSLFKRIEADGHKVGYGKGVEQAAKDAKKQIEDTIEFEKKRLAAMEPLEKERVSRIESENTTLSSRLAEMSKEADRTLKSREEAHAREIVQRTEQIQRREARIRDLTSAQVRGEAVHAGARDESLDELAIIIGNQLGYDDDMMPFIKGPDGSPLMAAGKRVTLEQHVKQYLDNHAHHRKASTGRGGDARGGASLRSNLSAGFDKAKERLESGDRSFDAINDVFSARLSKRKSG